MMIIFDSLLKKLKSYLLRNQKHKCFLFDLIPSNLLLKRRRGSPFVEEAGLILIGLFFFVILYSVFSDIIDQFISIINEILNGITI